MCSFCDRFCRQKFTDHRQETGHWLIWMEHWLNSYSRLKSNWCIMHRNKCCLWLKPLSLTSFYQMWLCGAPVFMCIQFSSKYVFNFFLHSIRSQYVYMSMMCVVLRCTIMGLPTCYYLCNRSTYTLNHFLFTLPFSFIKWS